MTQLVVLRFGDVDGARRALAAVRALEELRYAWVDDVVVVERHHHGRVTVHTPRASAVEGAWWGALAGMVVGWWFPPLAFLAAAGAGAGAGAAVGELSKQHGLDDGLVARVRAALEPGTSALVMIRPRGDVAEMGRAFEPHHPVAVVCEDLAEETVAALRSSLTEASPSD